VSQDAVLYVVLKDGFEQLIFRDFRPVFDQKLEMGLHKRKRKLPPSGRFSIIPRRVWLIFGGVHSARCPKASVQFNGLCTV
jgi:hypothetical protein